MKQAQHKGRGHRGRLRERFLNSGLSGFHDYEVIELLLTLSTPRKDCKDIAKDAIKHFKTFQGVLDASSKELQQINGIGSTNLLGIKLVKAVSERYVEKKLLDKDIINSSKELYDYLCHMIRGKDKELFIAIFLDARNRVISAKTLFEGTLTSTSVYPREVIKEALRQQSAAILFAHNHPSGDPNPSQDDKLITRELIFACRLMGITVHEHIIIGANHYFSFADHGYIKKLNREFNSIQVRNSSENFAQWNDDSNEF